MSKLKIPEDIELLKQRVILALGDVKTVQSNTEADKNFLFNAKRTNAGRSLPPYYLVFFLLNDFLGFKNLGRFEKTSWSLPIDFRGKAFLIEHRKFGLGIFADNLQTDEIEAQEIVKNIHKAVKVAKPYFEWVASEAVKSSKLNVKNNSFNLFQRYQYLVDLYKKEKQEAEDRKDEVHRETKKTSYGEVTSFHTPSTQLRRNANWLATSAIEAFFSWTEHLFVHLSIVGQSIYDGEKVANLAGAEWQVKYTTAIDIDIKENKTFFDELISLRRQFRNFIAHGAFGKNGETFTFHSSAGAVPVLMPHQKGKNKFSLFGDLSFNEDEVISLLERFIEYLWSSETQPAMHYVMESGLPTILTMASDGSYRRAMASMKDMESFVEYLSYQFDQAANMDW